MGKNAKRRKEAKIEEKLKRIGGAESGACGCGHEHHHDHHHGHAHAAPAILDIDAAVNAVLSTQVSSKP